MAFWAGFYFKVLGNLILLLGSRQGSKAPECRVCQVSILGIIVALFGTYVLVDEYLDPYGEGIAIAVRLLKPPTEIQNLPLKAFGALRWWMGVPLACFELLRP